MHVRRTSRSNSIIIFGNFAEVSLGQEFKVIWRGVLCTYPGSDEHILHRMTFLPYYKRTEADLYTSNRKRKPQLLDLLVWSRLSVSSLEPWKQDSNFCFFSSCILLLYSSGGEKYFHIIILEFFAYRWNLLWKWAFECGKLLETKQIFYYIASFKALTVYKTIVTNETDLHSFQALVVGMAGLLETEQLDQVGSISVAMKTNNLIWPF